MRAGPYPRITLSFGLKSPRSHLAPEQLAPAGNHPGLGQPRRNRRVAAVLDPSGFMGSCQLAERPLAGSRVRQGNARDSPRAV